VDCKEDLKQELISFYFHEVCEIHEGSLNFEAPLCVYDEISQLYKTIGP